MTVRIQCTHRDYDLDFDYRQWCRSNIESRDWYTRVEEDKSGRGFFVYYFSDEHDAVMFRLKFNI